MKKVMFSIVFLFSVGFIQAQDLSEVHVGDFVTILINLSNKAVITVKDKTTPLLDDNGKKISLISNNFGEILNIMYAKGFEYVDTIKIDSTGIIFRKV